MLLYTLWSIQVLHKLEHTHIHTHTHTHTHTYTRTHNTHTYIASYTHTETKENIDGSLSKKECTELSLHFSLEVHACQLRKGNKDRIERGNLGYGVANLENIFANSLHSTKNS